MWKGFVTFGLVTIPVRLYSAVEPAAEVRFHLLHAADRGRIRYRRVCETCQREVDWPEIVKGYEYVEGEYVEMTDEDLAGADVRASQSVDIQEFVIETEIDTKLFEHPYYLEPQRGGEKPYALLREALSRSGRVGVAKVVLRSREQLAVVRPDAGGTLVLEAMRFTDEIRGPTELKVPANVEIQDREISLAASLIDQMTSTFDATRYRDEYREKVSEIVRRKVEGAGPAARGKVPTPTKVVDLMEVLQRSLEERTRAAGPSAPRRGTRTPARKAAGGNRGRRG